MLFIINVVIAVATLWNAAEDHLKALSDFRGAVGAERAKQGRKLLLLWLVPVLSIAAIPLTWQESTDSERKIAEANTAAANANKLAAESNERASSNELARVKLEAQIAGLNPLKQPVVSLSAYASFEIAGDRAITTNRNTATRYCAFLNMWSVRQSGITNSLYPSISLSAEDFDGWSGGEVQMFLRPAGFEVRDFPGTAGELLDKLDALQMGLYFLSNTGTNCRGGFVILTVNSLLTKRFEIPPQGKGHIPFHFYGSATNQVVYDPANGRWILVER